MTNNLVSNKQFLRAVFSGAPSNLGAFVTHFKTDPSTKDQSRPDSRWRGHFMEISSCPDYLNENAYFSVALFELNAKRQIQYSKGMYLVCLDDATELSIEPSWKLETSSGNFQLGFILDKPIIDQEVATRLLENITTNSQKLKVDKSGNNIVRWIRLPVGINTKDGQNFKHRLIDFEPSRRYTLDQIIAALELNRNYILFGIPNQNKPILGPINGFDTFGMAVDSSELIAQIKSGEHFHEPMLKLTAHYVAKGLSSREVLLACENIMLSIPEADRRLNWKNDFADLRHLIEGADKKFGNGKEEIKPTFEELEQMFPKVQINAEVPRAPNFVIDGLLTDEIFSIAGAPGSGKSSMLFQLAMAAAHLCPDEYELKPLLRRKVVYLTEDSRQAEDILYGMTHWGGVKASQEEIDKWLTVIEVHRVKPEILGSVIEWKAEQDTVYQEGQNGRSVRVPPLIVFDTAAATFDLENESDNSEVSGAISKVKQACSVTKVPLWIIAHTPKIQRNDIKNLSVRGAGAWTGDVNGTAYVFKDDDGKSNQRYLSLGKTRFEPEFTEIEFDTQTHSTIAEHELGHFVEKRYRVGLSKKSSEEVRMQKKIAKAEGQVVERENQILFELVNATNKLIEEGEKTTKTAVRKLVAGKNDTKVQLMQALIDDEELVLEKDGTLSIGHGEIVERVKGFSV